MKKKIHPKYNDKSSVSCACGASFTMGSTEEKLEVEVCSNCHPFYTGDASTKKAAGRVERFQTRRDAAKSGVKSKQVKRAEKRATRIEKNTAQAEADQKG